MQSMKIPLALHLSKRLKVCLGEQEEPADAVAAEADESVTAEVGACVFA